MKWHTLPHWRHLANRLDPPPLIAVAGLLTAYTAYDMLRYNRKRKAEFLEAQRQMGADSLEAARLAYMRGDATEDQMSLVEEANARIGPAGGEGFKLPSILSAPKPITREEEEEKAAAAAESAASAAGGESAQGDKKSSGLFGWFSSSGPGGDSTSKDAPRAAATLEDKQDMIRKAREAFEKEKEAQRNGGPLDRIGTQPIQPEQPKKKGWLW